MGKKVASIRAFPIRNVVSFGVRVLGGFTGYEQYCRQIAVRTANSILKQRKGHIPEEESFPEFTVEMQTNRKQISGIGVADGMEEKYLKRWNSYYPTFHKKLVLMLNALHMLLSNYEHTYDDDIATVENIQTANSSLRYPMKYMRQEIITKGYAPVLRSDTWLHGYLGMVRDIVDFAGRKRYCSMTALLRNQWSYKKAIEILKNGSNEEKKLLVGGVLLSLGEFRYHTTNTPFSRRAIMRLAHIWRHDLKVSKAPTRPAFWDRYISWEENHWWESTRYANVLPDEIPIEFTEWRTVSLDQLFDLEFEMPKKEAKKVKPKTKTSPKPRRNVSAYTISIPALVPTTATADSMTTTANTDVFSDGWFRTEIGLIDFPW